MADDNDNTPVNDDKPTPRRRASRKSPSKSDAAKPNAAKPSAAKRASRPATTSPKKPAATKAVAKPAPKRASSSAGKSDSTTGRARASVTKAADAVGGKRNIGLIAGGLAVAGAAAAALLSLRSSTPKNKGASPVDPGAKAHQPDGTDSSASFQAGIADESTIPETPQA